MQLKKRAQFTTSRLCTRAMTFQSFFFSGDINNIGVLLDRNKIALVSQLGLYKLVFRCSKAAGLSTRITRICTTLLWTALRKVYLHQHLYNGALIWQAALTSPVSGQDSSLLCLRRSIGVYCRDKATSFITPKERTIRGFVHIGSIVILSSRRFGYAVSALKIFSINHNGTTKEIKDLT